MGEPTKEQIEGEYGRGFADGAAGAFAWQQRAQQAEARLREVVEAAVTAADGLEGDAVEIRGDWSDFDGRSNLHCVRDWLKPLRAALAAAQPKGEP